jgi:DNA-binding GntR family transcriptional regulator
MADASPVRRPRPALRSAEERASGSVATRTFEVLLDQIQTFRLKPYELVSEKAMSEALGVSRTPVREALARLARVGLIDIYPQRGSVVAPLRMSDLAKSQFLREALEVGLMLRALESPDRMALVQRLRNELAVQETFAAISDDRRFYKSDEALHQHIANHAGFPGIWTDIMNAKLHMDRFRYLTFPRIDNMSIVLGQHRAIVDALEAGDKVAAEDAMRSHLRRVLSVVQVARERFPDYFDPADLPAVEELT